MLSQIVLWRLDLVDDVGTSTCVTLGLAQVVDVVLVLEGCGAVLLVLEDFGQDAFSLSGVRVSVVLNGHASAVNSVKLTFNLASRRSLTAWIGATLSH